MNHSIAEMVVVVKMTVVVPPATVEAVNPIKNLHDIEEFLRVFDWTDWNSSARSGYLCLYNIHNMREI